MSWFWLNIPLGAVFFLATAGIPLVLVLKHPDERASGQQEPQQQERRARDATPQSRPVFRPQLNPVG